MDKTELIKKINGMFRVSTDMVKTDPIEIEIEKIDNSYNLALQNVIDLIKNSNG